MNNFNIKEIVKDNFVYLDSVTNSFANYKVWINSLPVNERVFIFPVPLNDIGTATLGKKEKAILFMRWIRKAIEDNTFINCNG